MSDLLVVLAIIYGAANGGLVGAIVCGLIATAFLNPPNPRDRRRGTTVDYIRRGLGL